MNKSTRLSRTLISLIKLREFDVLSKFSLLFSFVVISLELKLNVKSIFIFDLASGFMLEIVCFNQTNSMKTIDGFITEILQR